MVSTKEHNSLKGFFEIPGWAFIYINEDGVVWDEYFKEYVRPSYGMSPYPELVPTGMAKPISLHRALALTFLECPGDPINFQVDHINGDKTDYRLSNLEWVTRQENVIRAFRSGKRKDCRKVLLKDLLTDEVLEFYSITACAKHLKLHPNYLCLYLKRPQPFAFRERYDLVHEGTPWRLTKKDLGSHAAGKPKEVIAIRDDLSEAIIFGSMAQACAHTGAKQSQVAKRLVDSALGPVNGWRFCYLLQYLGDVSKAKRIASKRSTNFDKNRFTSTPRPIVVRDQKTGEETNWISVEDFATSLELCKKTIQKSMNINSGWYKTYHIRYANSLPS